MNNSAIYRSLIFRYLDGLVTAPSAFVLHDRGVTRLLLEQKQVDVDELAQQLNCSAGYLNVALRVLSSQGWLDVETSIDERVIYSINSKSAIAFPLFEHYRQVVSLMKLSAQYHPRKFEREAFDFWHGCATQYSKYMGMVLAGDDTEERRIQDQILTHIEGVLVAPSFVHLGMSGMFHKYFMEVSFSPEEFHKDPEAFTLLLDFFCALGFFVKKSNATYQFTEKGVFFAKRAAAFGVTVSYTPTLRSLDQLIFSDPLYLQTKLNEPERHVDREMNVWGSGGAHSTYFNQVDEIIISIFNRPIQQQPKGVLDMGCGNGAFLLHLYDVIAHRTERGKVLDEHPLFLIGADYNQAALRVTRQNLVHAGVWAKVIWGDIGRPDLLAQDLSENYGLDLSKILNVRTFLDHNRIWEQVNQVDDLPKSTTTGAFASKGNRLKGSLVEQSLYEHIQKWQPWIQEFGLLLIELHTIDPMLAAQNIGKTAATAYDATHGYSDQYILEHEVFLKVAQRAGLKSVPQYQSRYPEGPTVTVSVQLLI
jgi:SAM-dependent methyltransferase